MKFVGLIASKLGKTKFDASLTATAYIVCIYTLQSNLLATGQINTIGKVLQQSCDDCDDRKTSTIERCYKGKEEGYSLILEDSAFTGEIFTK